MHRSNIPPVKYRYQSYGGNCYRSGNTTPDYSFDSPDEYLAGIVEKNIYRLFPLQHQTGDSCLSSLS